MITRDEFQRMMDDTMPTVRFGNLNYDWGWALRKLDPIAFDESYWEYVHMMEEETA